jgi:hypothetical protein
MDLRPLALVLVLAAQPVAANGGTVRGISGADLMAACTAPDEASGSFCNGYITGLMDAEQLHPAISPMCLPRHADVITVRLWFTAWTARRPIADLSRAAGSLFREAVNSQWPCENRPA